jgi:hypothetical protein
VYFANFEKKIASSNMDRRRPREEGVLVLNYQLVPGNNRRLNHVDTAKTRTKMEFKIAGGENEREKVTDRT